MNIGLTDSDHTLFMLDAHSQEIRSIHAAFCKRGNLSSASRFNTWLYMQREILSIVTASDGLPTWEVVRKTLEDIYKPSGHKPTSGGYGAVYCEHKFVHLGANRGFCEHCDSSGTINSDGEIEWA